MQRIRSFHQFLLEASSQDVQNLIQKLQSEADSEKMRIGGTSDKIDWAMKFVVLSAFVKQLQDDLAKGKTDAPNYPEDLYNSIDGRSTDLKNKAIEMMKMNGLSDDAAEQLQVTPVETEQHAESTPEPQQAQPNPAPVQEAKNWSLVKIVPNTLQAEKKKTRRVTPKSPAERAFRTAFNHARNEARKVLEPKIEEPQQPAAATPPPAQANPQTSLGV